MEFNDVEVINRKVLVRIYDKINLTVLLPYLKAWLPTITYQGLETCINIHGEAYATATKFLDQFRSRCRLFPKMLAALMHTGQTDVYDIFMNEIRNYFKDKEGVNGSKYKNIMKLIEDAAKEFSGEPVADDRNRTEGNRSKLGSQSRSSEGTRGPGSGQSDNKGDNQTSETEEYDSRRQGDGADGGGRVAPLDGATGIGQPCSRSYDTPPARPPDRPNVCTSRIDTTVSGCQISDLRANVFTKLGKVLQETNNEGQQWWSFLVENEDIDISHAEHNSLERSSKPGKEFLNLLAQRNYTLDQLQELFATNDINNALQILVDNQNKVVRNKSSLSSIEANNLNTDPQKKELPSKMNIPGGVSLTGNIQTEGCQGTIPYQRQSTTSLESFEDNTVVTNISDESVKGTRPIQAHSDREPHEGHVYENIPSSSGNLPLLSGLRSVNPPLESNRDSGNIVVTNRERGNNEAEGANRDSCDINAEGANRDSGNLEDEGVNRERGDDEGDGANRESGDLGADVADRGSGDLNAVHDATRNTNVESKPPRVEVYLPITSNVQPIPASMSLSEIVNRPNNDDDDRQNNDDGDGLNNNRQNADGDDDRQNNDGDDDDHDERLINDDNNDDVAAETEAGTQVTMATRTNESSNTSGPLPTVIDDISTSYSSLNVDSLNETSTDIRAECDQL